MTVLPKLEDLNVEGKTVFLRLDLNVPIKDGKITDDTRIQKALPTIEYLLKKSRKLVIASHLGRPKGVSPEHSLGPVGERLASLIRKEVLLVQDYDVEPIDQLIKQLGKDQVVLLENLRFFPQETKNDKDFATNLVKGSDCYVDDAFGAVHRAHASVAAAAQLFPRSKKACGFLIAKETEALDALMHRPSAPYTVIVGGAKVADKIGVILNLLERCNNLLLGGAMAYTFMRYMSKKVGKSLVEEDKMDLVESIYRTAKTHNVKVYLPEDHVVAPAFGAEGLSVVSDIPDDRMGLDIGPRTAAIYADVIKQSKTVFWNGPMGVCEIPALAKGTLALAEAVASCSAYTVVGGGDSIAAINQAGVADKIGHVSTGGGASLQYLEGAHLPGLKALASDIGGI